MEDPGSFGSGSRICWIAGGLGSRIQDLLDPGSGGLESNGDLQERGLVQEGVNSKGDRALLLLKN